MKNRHINHVTVLGSGIMGAGIACQFANIGVKVLLLDIVPNELNDRENKKGLSLNDKLVKNRIAHENLAKSISSNPAPLYHKKFIDRITVGNFDDDLEKIKNSDWIIEVVVERLDIKKSVYEKVEQFRKEGTLITSNTSGIPISMLVDGRSNDFKKYFAGTHFFNPVRYLKLLEIIPTKDTDKDITNFYMSYGDKFLGKTTVLCKDTPAFIANRVGVFSIMNLFNSVAELGLTVEDLDKLTGPIIGRPKSATFRTADVVGLDTLVHVANGIYNACPNDEAKEQFKLPDFIKKMMEKKWLGSKTGQGFYKKVDKDILSLDLKTLEYKSQQKNSFPTLELTKNIDNVIDRFNVLINGTDVAAEFYRKSLGALFAYVSHRIPEISDEIYRLDDAMRTGFGWEHGPFQIWDAIGIKKGIELAEKTGNKTAEWVNSLSSDSFYTINEQGKQLFFDLNTKEHKLMPSQDNQIILNNIRPTKEIWNNKGGVSIQDLGEGILNIEFQSKMNSLGAEVMAGINKAIDIAEVDYKGIVISNQGQNFSVGANLAMIMMLALDQEWDDLNTAISYFQKTIMRVRYSKVPIIVCPHGMTLGGGCELAMHADKVVATPETYIGLVEFGVGVIPAGGGTKELTKRVLDQLQKDDVATNRLREAYLNIAMAKVATSAYEAIDLGILQQHKDIIVVNKDRQISEAKKQCIALSDMGYTQPISNKIRVLGNEALGMFLVGSDQMVAGNYISDHDRLIANKLAYVMIGGNLSEASEVSEQYLLDLEREAFLSLCGERKTLERIQSMLKTGKPLRN